MKRRDFRFSSRTNTWSFRKYRMVTFRDDMLYINTIGKFNLCTNFGRNFRNTFLRPLFVCLLLLGVGVISLLTSFRLFFVFWISRFYYLYVLSQNHRQSSSRKTSPEIFFFFREVIRTLNDTFLFKLKLRVCFWAFRDWTFLWLYRFCKWSSLIILFF